jgi:hypothetical protein
MAYIVCSRTIGEVRALVLADYSENQSGADASKRENIEAAHGAKNSLTVSKFHMHIYRSNSIC